MEHIKSYHLIKEKGIYILMIQLNQIDTEFSQEFMEAEKPIESNFYDDIRSHIKSKFPGISIPFVKIMRGSALLATIPLSSQVPAVEKMDGEGLSIFYKDYIVKEKDTLWDIAIEWGIPLEELKIINGFNDNSILKIGKVIRIPIHKIPIKGTPGARFGEYLDWWTQAQYIFTINKVGRVKDLETGKSFSVRRCVGTNHAVAKSTSYIDNEIARSIWGEDIWSIKPAIIEVEGRKLAASISFVPKNIMELGKTRFDGYFDIHFLNSTRHNDGKIDPGHQNAIQISSGMSEAAIS